jgi:hypothetical protein
MNFALSSPLHKRLIGVWKSDRRKTLKHCHKYHCLKGTKKRTFAGLFGKLELRFTKQYVYHTLRDFKYRSRYEVVAEDAESVVLRIYPDTLKKKFDPIMADAIKELLLPRLEQFHFVRYRGRQYFWIGLGTFCEWFAPIETANTHTEDLK